ncbi:hypothetical protein JOC77_002487 [Peribacillus deserti]|uniref:Rok N-terminal oligomerisation domain-containing protein n=1 Tax=Peribacillus deserti TaxID=673318 RepID=A0ABS2QIR4_9BACI|nr:hypothetical protein [Peribacillus deserti]MBM7693048.1 hypothetical protein [Peribacillus deserti]
MEFNERTALKMRLEQLSQYEKDVFEQIRLERTDILRRVKELEVIENESANYHFTKQANNGKIFSALVYLKR